MLRTQLPISEAIRSLALNDSVLHPLERRKLLSRGIYTIDLIILSISQISLYRTHSALPAALPTQACSLDNDIDNEIRKPSAESPHVRLRRLVRCMADVSWLEPGPVHCKSGLLTVCVDCEHGKIAGTDHAFPSLPLNGSRSLFLQNLALICPVLLPEQTPKCRSASPPAAPASWSASLTTRAGW